MASSDSAFRVVIVGAGIGGATLSLLLKKFVPNVHCTILEMRTEEVVRTSGGGFNIAPNGMRVLEMADLSERASKCGCIASDFVFRNLYDQEIVRCQLRSDPSAPLNITEGGVTMPRAELAALLVDGMQDRSVDARFGVKVERIIDDADGGNDGPVVVELDNGDKIECDLVVGADGAHSRTRGFLFPTHEKAVPAAVGLGGFVDIEVAKRNGDGLEEARQQGLSFAQGWQLIKSEAGGGGGGESSSSAAPNPSSSSSANQPLPHTFGVDAASLQFTMGYQGQFGFASGSPDGRMWMWWCHVDGDQFDALVKEKGINGDPLSFPAQVAIRDWVLQMYGDWHSPIASLVKASPGIICPRVFLVSNLPAWHKGRCVLLGDAAHAMSPTSGQGASMALEDAFVLAKLIRNLTKEGARPSPNELSLGLDRDYEKVRRSRCEALFAQAVKNEQRQQQKIGGFGMWLRDKIFFPLFAKYIIASIKGVYEYKMEWE